MQPNFIARIKSSEGQTVRVTTVGGFAYYGILKTFDDYLIVATENPNRTVGAAMINVTIPYTAVGSIYDAFRQEVRLEESL